MTLWSFCLLRLVGRRTRVIVIQSVIATEDEVRTIMSLPKEGGVMECKGSSQERMDGSFTHFRKGKNAGVVDEEGVARR